MEELIQNLVEEYKMMSQVCRADFGTSNKTKASIWWSQLMARREHCTKILNEEWKRKKKSIKFFIFCFDLPKRKKKSILGRKWEKSQFLKRTFFPSCQMTTAITIWSHFKKRNQKGVEQNKMTLQSHWVLLCHSKPFAAKWSNC